jgi:hypothetical protein
VTDVFDQVRQACADVADRARHVRIDQAAVAQLAAMLPRTPPELLPEEQGRGEPADIAAQVVAWNMINFGSGWFPKLTKREGLSGARSLAQAFDEHVARYGAPTAVWLVAMDMPTCAKLFGQPHPGPVDELLRLFTQAWNDLGRLLLERYDGQAANLVEASKGSAAKLVEILDQMPLVHDVARYDGHSVPLFKRAQITASHLHRALGEPGPGELGHFTDLGRLTAFADNLVPHTLRMLDVLVYDDETSARIAGDDLFTPGEPAEIEIRASGVHAIELVVEHLAHPPAPDDGSDRPEPFVTDAATLDHHLWQLGQSPEIKAVRRHRCRCPWY